MSDLSLLHKRAAQAVEMCRRLSMHTDALSRILLKPNVYTQQDLSDIDRFTTPILSRCRQSNPHSADHSRRQSA